MEEKSRPHPWSRIERLTRKLRGEGGCDWDRAQTPESLAPYLIEEIHEAIEALHIGKREDLTEEIGDAIYLWVFFLQVLEESARVSVEEAVRGIEEKLIRRHPHVFGAPTDERSAAEMTPPPRRAPIEEERGSWEMRKRSETGSECDVLRPLPPGIPALLKARRLQEKAAGFGFDWREPADVLPKMREELAELQVEIERDPRSPRVREELGDLLFAVVNVARHLGEDPEATLLAATEKFRRRFNAMVRSVEAAGHPLDHASLDLMEEHWQSIKDADSSPSENPREDRP